MVGTNSLTRKDVNRRFLKIKKIILHPSFLFDIMLLEVSYIPMSKNIQSVELVAMNDQLEDGRMCFTDGWGMSNFTLS